jgi:hypothetical protein
VFQHLDILTQLNLLKQNKMKAKRTRIKAIKVASGKPGKSRILSHENINPAVAALTAMFASI